MSNVPGSECGLRITGTLIEFLRHLIDNDYLQNEKIFAYVLIGYEV